MKTDNGTWYKVDLISRLIWCSLSNRCHVNRVCYGSAGRAVPKVSSRQVQQTACWWISLPTLITASPAHCWAGGETNSWAWTRNMTPLEVKSFEGFYGLSNTETGKNSEKNRLNMCLISWTITIRAALEQRNKTWTCFFFLPVLWNKLQSNIVFIPCLL